jgi:hypothetical protein
MNPWINFFVVICVQLLFFLILLYQKRTFKTITPGLILKSVAAGVVFGMAFDLLVGRYLGIFSYALHFQPLFLVINGTLSYGLWFLTLWLLQSERFLSFCGWNIALGLVYEVTNHFYPVWSLTFGGSFLYQASMVILVEYCGLALLVAFVASLTKQAQFRAFTLKV